MGQGTGVSDDGGPRQQPELAEATAFCAEASPPPSERSLFDDDDDSPPSIPRQIDPALQRTARLASLDPDDGIPL